MNADQNETKIETTNSLKDLISLFSDPLIALIRRLNDFAPALALDLW